MDSLQAFAQLKKLLLCRYQEVYPHFQGSLREFRQKDILNFQLLLEENVHARVSEKWFYTHLKVAENKKLPRIDTLNLLARFVGYSSWEVFCHELQQTAPAERPLSANSRWKWLWIAALPAIIGLAILFLVKTTPPDTQICFIDALRQTAINEQPVQVKIITKDQQTLSFQTDTMGCLWLPSDQVTGATLMVNSPYYLPDTIKLADEESPGAYLELSLQSDDYALMIHYFSNSKIADWKRRKAQLNAIFAEHAIIYQVDPDGQLGMDILNKSEFINKLVIPINSLQNVEVLQTKYELDQIVELRFRVKR
ncbi:MAG: hypothetical protein AAGJ93_11815 [Bacteroidota bacterium]